MYCKILVFKGPKYYILIVESWKIHGNCWGNALIYAGWKLSILSKSIEITEEMR